MRKIFTLFAAATLTAAAVWADDTTTPTGMFVYDLDATTTQTIPAGTTAIKVVGTLDATKAATLKAAVPATVTQWLMQECDDADKAALTLFQGNTTATDIILPASFVTTDATTGYASDFTDAEKAVFDAIGTQLHSVVAAGPKTTSGMEEVTRTESKQVEVISKNWDGTINYKKDSNGNPIQKTDADGNPVYEKNDDGTYKTDDTGNKIPVYEPETYMEWQQVPVTTTEMVYHYPTALTAYIKQPGTLWTQTATKTNFPDLWSSQGSVSEKIHVPAITATGTLALTDLHKFDNQGNANQDEMIGSGITHLDLSGATLQADMGVEEAKVFKADDKMQKVKLPEGITHIVGSDFLDGELLEIEFPTTVTEIGVNAFQNCAKLATATFRETSDGSIAPVTTIGENAFKSTQITSFTIPQTVTSLGQSAFLDCKELASVTLDPECAITTIPYKCFEDTKITEITIPNSVTEICEAAFNGCPLTTVNYGEHPVITKIGKDAFKHTLLTSITIPEGVTEIGEGAFNTEQDHGLEMLIIPASVQKIGAEAFLNQWFKDIFFYGLDAPEIAGKTFMPGQYYGSGSFSADDIRVLDPDGNYVMNSDGSYKKGKDIATGIGSSTEKTTVDAKKAEGYSFVANHEMYENGDNQGHYTSSIHLRAELLNDGAPEGETETYREKLLKYTDPTRSYMLDDDLLGTSQHWPTHNEMEAAYKLAEEGKLSDGTTYPAGTTTNTEAWKNLHKFVLVSFDINNSSQTEWELPDNKFNNGFWWSICLPFDLTKKQVLDVFGSKTRLCRFNRVERTYDADKQSWHLGLHFTDEVCQYKTVEGVRQKVGDDEVVMHSHAPYMIHPQTDSEKPGDVGVKTIPYELTKGGEPQRVWQVATTTDDKGQTQTRRYAFVGNYKAKDNNGNSVLMPDYCYFMYYQNVGKSNEKHTLAVKPDYKTTWPFGTYSAIVVQHTPNEARDDAHIFFPTAITKQHGASTTTAAKGSTFVPVWGEEEENVAQGIEEVEFIFPDGERHPGGIYNMSGQRVSGQPQPGLYIRDGRKTVIR